MAGARDIHVHGQKDCRVDVGIPEGQHVRVHFWWQSGFDVLRLVDRSLRLGSLRHRYWTGHIELPWGLLQLQSSVVFLLPVLTLNGGRCVGQSEVMSP